MGRRDAPLIKSFILAPTTLGDDRNSKFTYFTSKANQVPTNPVPNENPHLETRVTNRRNCTHITEMIQLTKFI